jgi:hypothetical protein
VEVMAQAGNNPIKYIDFMGMGPVGADGMTNEQWMSATNPANNGSQATNGKTAASSYQQQNRSDEVERLRNGQSREVRSDDIAGSYQLQEYGLKFYRGNGDCIGKIIEGYKLVECDRQCLISKGRQFVQVLAVGLVAYGGTKEIEAGYAAGLLGNLPLAGYLISDGAVRIGSSPFKIYGILTGKKEIINSPYNLLGLIGYIIDRYGGSPFQTGNPSGGPYQTAGELMGDYGLSRYNLLSNVDKYVSEPTLLKLGIIINSITLPVRQVIQRYFDGRLPKP